VPRERSTTEAEGGGALGGAAIRAIGMGGTVEKPAKYLPWDGPLFAGRAAFHRMEIICRGGL